MVADLRLTLCRFHDRLSTIRNDLQSVLVSVPFFGAGDERETLQQLSEISSLRNLTLSGCALTLL